MNIEKDGNRYGQDMQSGIRRADMVTQIPGMNIPDRGTRCLSDIQFFSEVNPAAADFCIDLFLRRMCVLRNYKIQGAINK